MGKLVLSRKIGQSIEIDGPCTITLERIQGDKVKLSFEAEVGTRILRTELIGREALEPAA